MDSDAGRGSVTVSGQLVATARGGAVSPGDGSDSGGGSEPNGGSDTSRGAQLRRFCQTRAKTFREGQAEASQTQTWWTVTVTAAPILSSLVRIVSHRAAASGVPFNPRSRRTCSTA